MYIYIYDLLDQLTIHQPTESFQAADAEVSGATALVDPGRFGRSLGQPTHRFALSAQGTWYLGDGRRANSER
jgi:hypothetical protein